MQFDDLKKLPRRHDQVERGSCPGSRLSRKTKEESYDSLVVPVFTWRVIKVTCRLQKGRYGRLEDGEGEVGVSRDRTVVKPS